MWSFTCITVLSTSVACFSPLQAKLNVVQSIQRFLSKYGFRCINELKLEEHTLHDDPGFVLDTIAGVYMCMY